VISDTARQRFAEVALPHLDDAYGLARWLTGNRDDAQDVVQEACLRALGALDKGTVERPRAWLLAIVRNTAFTWLAKNRPAAVLVTDEMQVFEAAAAAGGEAGPLDPEAALIAKAEAAAIEAAIAALPIVFREVLVMREIQGLGYRDIAEATSLPVGTVMSRLARARAQLAAKLGSLR